MIYFSTRETLSAIFSFFVLGGFFGGIYNSFELLITFLKQVVVIPICIFKKYIVSNKKRVKFRQKRKTSIYKSVFDFLFILICALFFILFSYLFLDAAIRMFTLISFSLGCVISYKFLGRQFSGLIRKITDIIYKALYSIFSLLIYPLFLLSRVIKKLLMPIINYVFSCFIIYRNKRIITKKVKAVEKLYKL